MKTTLTGLLFGLFLLAGCTNASSGNQTDAGTTQADGQTEMATTDDSDSDDDAKSERISPPKAADGAIGEMAVKVNYSSPKVKGRKIWGGLVPYGEVWRTGANEATTISFSKTASVEGKKLAAGKYALFTIPGEEKWKVIFNTVAEQWGAYEYDKAKDALRVEVTPRVLENSIEDLTFAVTDSGIMLQWEKLEVPIKISAAN